RLSIALLLPFAAAIQPIGMLFALLSFVVFPGTHSIGATLFVLPHFLFTCIIALHALITLCSITQPSSSSISSSPFFQASTYTMEMSKLYLPIGAAWLIASRAGLSLSFEPVI